MTDDRVPGQIPTADNPEFNEPRGDDDECPTIPAPGGVEYDDVLSLLVESIPPSSKVPDVLIDPMPGELPQPMGVETSTATSGNTKDNPTQTIIGFIAGGSISFALLTALFFWPQLTADIHSGHVVETLTGGDDDVESALQIGPIQTLPALEREASSENGEREATAGASDNGANRRRDTNALGTASDMPRMAGTPNVAADNEAPNNEASLAEHSGSERASASALANAMNETENNTINTDRATQSQPENERDETAVRRRAQSPRINPDAPPLTHDMVQTVVRARQGRLQQCYTSAIRQTGDASEVHLTITMNVLPSGEVNRVEVTGDSMGDLTTCLRRTVRRWEFPESREGGQIPMPVSFAPRQN